MSTLDPQQTAAMQQITALTQVLYEALERQDSQQVLAAQQNLTTAAGA